MNSKKWLGILCSLILVGVLMVGCVPLSASSAASSATPARKYIIAVHDVFSDIDAQMEIVKKASSTDDRASVYAALDKVDEQLKALEAIEVPEGLEELQEAYLGASKKLATTVRSYVDYRLGGAAAVPEAAVTLAAIQADYDTAIDALRAADDLAKSL